jgi:hypothetical protein
MRKVLLTLSLVAVFVAGGLVVASNMGFKYVPNWTIPVNDYWISVSYNNQYSTADDICTDIGSTATQLSRFDTPTGFRSDWTCGGPGDDFSIIAGEGYYLRVNASTTTSVLVGSPATSVTVPPGGWAATALRDHLISIPYHTQATNAEDICNEISAVSGTTAAQMSRFDTPTNFRSDWTCGGPGDNFSIQIGEGYMARVSSGTAGFSPSHY